MKLHFFGTCSGTAPRPGRRHVAFAIETEGNLYWFDAGEGCSYTAHLMGIDLLSVCSVFISHTHMDHVGGLENLLWTIRKINIRSNRMKGKTIDVFIPNMQTWEGVMQVLSNTEGGFTCEFDIHAHPVEDGIIYHQNGFQVTAVHNHHMEKEESMPWRSFSFLIEAENRKIVYSGDVRNIDDLSSVLKGCDLLLMETGHHYSEDICRFIADSKIDIGQLGFIHHGKDVLENPEKALENARKILNIPIFVTDDGTTMEI